MANYYSHDLYCLPDDDDKPIGHCPNCKEAIYRWDKMIKIDGETVACEHCGEIVKAEDIYDETNARWL